MRVRVRYFASLVDLTGVAEEAVEAAPGEEIAALWRRLVERHPSLDGLGYRPLVACDLQYVAWSHRLEDEQEVAFLPPFSGG